jgi:hypothetical protein
MSEKLTGKERACGLTSSNILALSRRTEENQDNA